jgi:hypothetical protein
MAQRRVIFVDPFLSDIVGANGVVAPDQAKVKLRADEM